VDGLGGVAGRPLVVLPHVHQDRLRIARQSRARFFDRDLPDPWAGFVDELKKTGCVNHAAKLDHAPVGSTGKRAGARLRVVSGGVLGRLAAENVGRPRVAAGKGSRENAARDPPL